MCLVGPRQTETESTIGMIGDQRDPEELLEEGREQKAKQVIVASFAKFATASRSASCRITVSSSRASADEPQPVDAAKGKREPDEHEHGKHQAHAPGSATSHDCDSSLKRSVNAKYAPRTMTSAAKRRHAEFSVRRKLAHQGPSVFSASKRLRRLLVQRGVDVGDVEGLHGRRPLLQLASGVVELCRQRNASSFTNASASSPMTTTSFGCTMCSSRVSHPAAWASSPPSNLKQLVP